MYQWINVLLLLLQKSTLGKPKIFPQTIEYSAQKTHWSGPFVESCVMIPHAPVIEIMCKFVLLKNLVVHQDNIRMLMISFILITYLFDNVLKL